MFFTSVVASNIYAKTPNDDKSTVIEPVKTADMLFLLIVFLIEFGLFIWALMLAWKCGKQHKDRFVHIVAAFFCPLIYIVYYFITGCGHFDGCGIDFAPGAKDL